MKKIYTGVRGGLQKGFLVDDESYDWLQGGNWSCQKIGQRHYAFFVRYIPKYRRERIMMHRLIMGSPDGMDIDHINGNTLDNRVENLRVCTRTENLLNTGPNSNGRSGFKWVSWHEQSQGWRVIVSRDGIHEYGGTFKDPVAAAKRANGIAKRLHGEFAFQNPV